MLQNYNAFSNNFYYFELVDKQLFHTNNKHNNHLLLVVILFYNSHTRKRIDRILLAFALLFCVRSLGKLFLILTGLPLVFLFVGYFITCCVNCFLDFRFIGFGFVKLNDCISVFVGCF